MTKEEMYNAAIDLYKGTGQGLSMLLLYQYRSTIDELVADGLMKYVTQNYNHLPDEEWACLTGIYCVEENPPASIDLTFIRMYLIPGDLGLGLTIDDVKDDKEMMDKYEAWLKMHKEEIDKVHSLKKFDICQ